MVSVTRFLFKMSSRKYYYYRRPIWRPIRDPSVTEMPDRRPIESRPDSSSMYNGFQSRQVGLDVHGMSVSDGSPIRHVGFWLGKLVSIGFQMGLQWVSDRSPIRILFSWTYLRCIPIKSGCHVLQSYFKFKNKKTNNLFSFWLRYFQQKDPQNQ